MADVETQFAGSFPGKTVELCAAMLAIETEAADLCNGLFEEQLSSSIRPAPGPSPQNLAHLRTTTSVLYP